MDKRLTMLVVDDVEVNRALLRETFKESYDVVEAQDGLEAVAILREQPIDIVVLDLYMPKLDGMGVLRQMKAEQSLNHIPVIVKTAIDENKEIMALELGADDFVFSPCDPAIVRNRVDNIVQKRILERALMQRRIEEEHNLSQVRGAFIAEIARELKEPVQEIFSAATEACSFATEKEQMREALRRIKMQAESLQTLTEDIAELSDYDQEHMVLRNEPFQINEIVASVAEEFYGRCRKNGTGFKLEVHGILRESLVGDLGRVRQIWSNLLMNAYHYAGPCGGIETVFSERACDADKVELEIAVKAKKQIREAGEEKQMIAEDADGWSGLRIAISRGVTELMGGSFSEEEIEEGLAYRVKLFFSVEKKQGNHHKNFKSMETMILDEDELQANYLAAVFSRLGIKCKVAVCVEQAKAMLKESYENGNGYDICFVNWYMEGDRGREAIAQIRQEYGKDSLLLISATGEGEECHAEMKDQGIDYVLKKPVLQADVYNLMTEIYKSFVTRAKTRGTKYDFSKRRVLVVEDNAINAELLMDFLTEGKMQCDWVSNGQLTIEKYQSMGTGYYDAILMDIHMPVMDGYEATRAIRALAEEDAKTIPIIAVTENDSSENVIKSYEAGMNAFIPKPIDAETLYRTLNKYLR